MPICKKGCIVSYSTGDIFYTHGLPYNNTRITVTGLWNEVHLDSAKYRLWYTNGRTITTGNSQPWRHNDVTRTAICAALTGRSELTSSLRGMLRSIQLGERPWRWRPPSIRVTLTNDVIAMWGLGFPRRRQHSRGIPALTSSLRGMLRREWWRG